MKEMKLMPKIPMIVTKRLKLTAALVIVLIAGGIWWWQSGSADGEKKPYTLAVATQGDLEETVTAQGTLEPKEFVNVGAQVSGQLTKLYVEVGQNVSASQLIAEIDPRLYESRLEETQAQVKALRAQLDLAKQQHARNAQLVEAQAISKDAFDTTLASVKNLSAQIEQANSQLSEAKTNLGYTKIYAPIAGTVVSQTTKVGQTLNSNQTAPTVVEVANLDTMTVRAQVAEADIGKVTPGMPIYFTTLGGDKRWQTTVRQVIPSPEVVNDVVLYNVLADIENPTLENGRSLMTGMSTQMNFVVGDAKGAVLVPVSALGKKLGADATGTKYQIFVPQGPKGEDMVSKTIVVGLMDRSMAQVVSGLKAGDQVAVPTAVEKPGGAGGAARRKAMGPGL